MIMKSNGEATAESGAGVNEVIVGGRVQGSGHGALISEGQGRVLIS